MAKVYVSRGRTVVGDGGVKYGPGELIDLDPAEVARLKERGFVQDVAPVLFAPTEFNPAGVGLQNQDLQGPQFRK